MTLVQELFAEYVFAERSGDGDPRPFLNRAETSDRELLSEMIDSYLATAPGKPWDPSAFEGSPEQSLIEPLGRALNGISGTWPVLLPSLRERARIKRSDLVSKLAEKLGYPEQKQAVGDYYHGMEYGTLESDGVNGRVLNALGEILGTSADALGRSGQLIGGGAGQSIGEAVFARVEPLSNVEFDSDEGEIQDVLENRELDSDREAITELFTGGR